MICGLKHNVNKKKWTKVVQLQLGVNAQQYAINLVLIGNHMLCDHSGHLTSKHLENIKKGQGTSFIRKQQEQLNVHIKQVNKKSLTRMSARADKSLK